ncbi:MAG: glycosyl transferase group 1 [uncultured bacterium (gcode 4)]|uniref:Glycosyl transferase group 1 n=1 Tax=uncultured bacterium (gcode 4) TaxID=1234023 RepID=K2ADT8_9BACT|nr:MAG: glycosyl transferase group 1 [uncultured bacterium (gcode 4)]
MLIEGWKPFMWWWQIYTEYLCNYLINKYNTKIDLFTRKIIYDWKKIETDFEKISSSLNIYRIWPVSDFFNFFSRLLTLLNTIFFLYKKAKIEKYDLIHAHSSLPWLPAMIVWKLLKIPVVYTLHWSICLDIWKKNLCYYLEKLFYTKLKYSLIISVSKKILEYSCNTKNIKIIYPWVDIEKFNKFSNEKKYSWLNFLFVWRLEEQKWLKYLLKAISNVDKQLLENNRFNLNIVWDWKLKDKLIDLSKELKINNFINFKWKLSLDNLILEYKKNHIFILPSLAEWQPVVVFEAFANNLPVIATDVWDNRYFIKDWDNWFLIKSQDINWLKFIIEKILKINKLELEKMWNYWKELVLKDLLWDKIVDQIYWEYLLLIK